MRFDAPPTPNYTWTAMRSNSLRHLAAGIAAVALSWAGVAADASAAKCLYLSSYHKGYEWNDGIERGLDAALQGKCEVDKFYLDTNRHQDEAYAETIARAAKAHIEATKPDVVIACDDNASKYVVKPYYKDAALPIVFCGINWSVEPYGYPYSNVTGMIEISPIKPLIKSIKEILKKIKRGAYLGPDVISQHKEFELNRQVYAKEGIVITPIFVKTMEEWEAGYKKAQRADFVVVGNNGSLDDWDQDRARRYALAHAKTLTVTNYDWMVDTAMLAVTKVAEEQGEWAAEAALAILGGMKPGQIPIVPNRRWDLFVNPALLDKAGIRLPTRLMHQAVKTGDAG